MLRRIIFLLSFTLVINGAFAADPGTSNRKHYTSIYELLGAQPNPNVNQNGIGIYVYDGVESLDAIGPLQVFKTAGLNAFLVAKHKGTIKASNGLQFTVDKSIDEVSKLDVLMIAGGAYGSVNEIADQQVLDWIRQIDQNSIYTTSVCTGAWILGASGLLQGKNATTNWYRAEEILNKYGANFIQKRWVQDGKYWTSAGVTAGLDMSLALVNELFDKEFTQAIMLDLEYDPKPPIEGGSVKKTDRNIWELWQYMYDYYLLWFVQG